MNNAYSKIKELRIKKGLTQVQVAKKLGLKQNNYSNLEKGKSRLTVERLTLLAEILEVSVQEILGICEK